MSRLSFLRSDFKKCAIFKKPPKCLTVFSLRFIDSIIELVQCFNNQTVEGQYRKSREFAQFIIIRNQSDRFQKTTFDPIFKNLDPFRPVIPRNGMLPITRSESWGYRNIPKIQWAYRLPHMLSNSISSIFSLDTIVQSIAGRCIKSSGDHLSTRRRVQDLRTCFKEIV